ncbi:hypothetical protein [Bacillus manliponensis]|uniref:hypothetical protein n=1 Tax=Bacillus manliponensis TaxID=574376 RepID=UPI003517D7DC
MKKTNKQIISSALVGTFLFGVVAPLTFNAKEVKAAENEVVNTEITQQEIVELMELQSELNKHDLTVEDIMLGIQSELPTDPTPLQYTEHNHTSNVVMYGVKTQAAKIAAKQMIKNLQRVGRVAWDRTVRNYISKLPISQSAKNTLKKYLAYQFVMETLDIVVNFSGTITDAISKRLKSIGLPAWLADTTARAIVALLL